MPTFDRALRNLPRPLVRALRNGWLRLADWGKGRGRGDDLLPPRALHHVGAGDFHAIGRAYARHFVDLAGLQPHERVLDIGCGTGRMALPLRELLGPQGRYVGFDVARPAIAWCNTRIAAQDPRFQFYFADVRNDEYNPRGRVLAQDYGFPSADESVDFAFASSVFTHMRAPEVEHYLRELRRVLRHDGRALLSFFLLDDEARERMGRSGAVHDFSVPLPDGWTIDARTPERAIAYDEAQVRAMVERSGLQLRRPVMHGTWSGRAGLESQDLVLVEPAAGPHRAAG